MRNSRVAYNKEGKVLLKYCQPTNVEDLAVHEKVCYTNPFLKEVIVRVDFALPVLAINKSLPPKIVDSALSRFPISEPKKGVEQELQLARSGIKHRETEVIQWHYYGKDREKRLAITSNFILATYSHYTTYENLKSDFLVVLKSFFEMYPDNRATRVGLRYINRIDVNSSDQFSWSAHIKSNLLGLLGVFEDREILRRIWHVVEFRYDDLNIKFQFGLPNPDFPAVIKKRLFVLDIDGSVQGPQDQLEVAANIDQAHEKIQQLFEKSITDELRRVMGGNQTTNSKP